MQRTRGRAAAAAGLVSAVVLLGTAACSDDGGDENPLAGANQTASQATPGEEDPGGGGGGDAEGSAGRDAEPLATSQAQLPADPSNETLVPLTLEVVRLVRSGEMVEMEARLVNDGEEGGPSFEPWTLFGNPVGDYTISETGLVDPDGQRMYMPAMDSEDTCVCSGDMGSIAIPPGQSYVLTASFGGVPEDVGPVDLHFPEFPAVTGLEIE